MANLLLLPFVRWRAWPARSGHSRRVAPPSAHALAAVLLCCVVTAPRAQHAPAPQAPAPQAPAPQAPAQKSPAQEKNDYLVGARDILAIIVFNQADLSGKFLIDADGTFTFPLIGRVTASGLTVRGVEAELKKRLADGYFQNPQLSVSVEEYHSQRIFVVGEVRAAGSYPLHGNMSIIEALALAGAVTGPAIAEVIIVRPKGGEELSGPTLPTQAQNADVIRVDLNNLQEGALSENVQLQGGDTIFVPRAETVFVYGQVRSPGSYPIGRNATVMQVLALAGGVTDRGAANRARIVRVVNGSKQEIKVKLDDTVHPGDILVVPERFF